MTFIAYAAVISFLVYGHWVRHNIHRQYDLHRKTLFEINDPSDLIERPNRANAPSVATSRDLEANKAAAAAKPATV